ncbi:LacI family DNA-binding transcriptional regulator [Arthrobacter nitrophenolicus]|uniref:LacI family DNA-binding transcriptional regulator n=1 Tax=Arthrobacter nitrophenolicus TaxID=683150 RepID=UPI0014050CAF|nr:LacI family DNA-binding transcriptional regulator [Arthrobacter nitrophenolicus]
MKDEQEGRRRATSTDVARESGVSRATVSYVLNDTPNKHISPATRELVIRTARRLGHVPNPQARALKTGNSNIVLCLVPALTLGFVFDHALDALTRELARRGYVLLVHRISERVDSRAVRDIWKYLTPTLVVTIGGLPPAETAVLEKHAPAPVVSDYGIVEHGRIGQLQADYLIDRGHRRIGFVMPSDPALHAYAMDRAAGVTRACEKASLVPPVVAIVEESLKSYGNCLGVFERAGVTAACGHNDDVALMLLEALRDRRQSAPGDLAVIGADDIPLAERELTTVALNAEVCAASITNKVLAALGADNDLAPQGQLLSLIRRTSA